MTFLDRLTLYCVAATLGALRVAGMRSPLFQAAAHLFVGGLVGAAMTRTPGRPLFVGLAAALTVLETVCFLAGTL